MPALLPPAPARLHQPDQAGHRHDFAGALGHPRPDRWRAHLSGTLVDQRFTSTPISIAFLALAAGSILYVVIELLAVGRKLGFEPATGILAGLTLGFATDAILVVAGA